MVCYNSFCSLLMGDVSEINVMQATEIEKARAVARRALQTINQRHEVERLNVQIALLNLEHLFGTQVSDWN